MPQEIWSLLGSWLPLIVVIGVWLFFIRRMSTTNSGVRAVNDEALRIGRESLELQRETNELLQAIRASLEPRKDKG